MKRRTALKNTAWAIGGVLSAGTIATLFDSCVAPAEGEVWKPESLSVEQGKLVTKIADILIPSDDNTSGAVEAMVPQFIDQVVKVVFSEEERTRFGKGYDDFVQTAKDALGKSFADASAEEQLNFLKEQEKAALDANEPTYFGVLKELIYSGYFQSEVGATEVLVFDPLPGEYLGCIPLSDVGGSWTTFW